jgi:hypothetical protein
MPELDEDDEYFDVSPVFCTAISLRRYLCIAHDIQS